jgi:hypothetical protein
MTPHRLRRLAALCCAGWLAVLLDGCSGEQHPACPPGTACGLPYGARCTAHADCQTGFCEKEVCRYWEPLKPNGWWCGDDSDCQSGFCNDGRCTVLRPDLVPHGKACSADAQCQSGFCDRGTCARRVSWRLYGTPCVPVAPGTPLREIPEEACRAYLCMDGLCRSCQSDSECTRWQPAPGVEPSDEPLTCTKFLDWPGKQCGKVIPGQVCPDGTLPVPQAWSNEGSHPARAPPPPRRPEIDCRTWPDM